MSGVDSSLSTKKCRIHFLFGLATRGMLVSSAVNGCVCKSYPVEAPPSTGKCEEFSGLSRYGLLTKHNDKDLVTCVACNRF